MYDKHMSKVVGFVRLGEVDKQLPALEVDISQSPAADVTCIMTLMIRGIFSEIHFPLANFPTMGSELPCGRQWNTLSGVTSLSPSRLAMEAVLTESTSSPMGSSTKQLMPIVQKEGDCTFFRCATCDEDS